MYLKKGALTTLSFDVDVRLAVVRFDFRFDLLFLENNIVNLSVLRVKAKPVDASKDDTTSGHISHCGGQEGLEKETGDRNVSSQHHSHSCSIINNNE
jgi:hypothetical protein